MSLPVQAVFLQETGEEAIVQIYSDVELEDAIINHPEWRFQKIQTLRKDFDYWVNACENSFDEFGFEND